MHSINVNHQTMDHCFRSLKPSGKFRSHLAARAEWRPIEIITVSAFFSGSRFSRVDRQEKKSDWISKNARFQLCSVFLFVLYQSMTRSDRIVSRSSRAITDDLEPLTCRTRRRLRYQKSASLTAASDLGGFGACWLSLVIDQHLPAAQLVFAVAIAIACSVVLGVSDRRPGDASRARRRRASGRRQRCCCCCWRRLACWRLLLLLLPTCRPWPSLGCARRRRLLSSRARWTGAGGPERGRGHHDR